MLLSKSFLILCSAAVATARLLQYDEILTGALLLGEDTSDPNASPLDVFRNPNNHVVAVASVTVNAAHRASLKPSRKVADQDTYSGFKVTLFSFPGYEFNFAKFKDFSFHEKFDLEEYASAIYRDFARSDRSEADEVASALMGVVGDHLKEVKEEQGPVMNRVFSTIVIRQRTFTIQLEIVELSVHRRRGNYVATLEVRSFQVITPVLTARAKELSENIPIVPVKDFIKYFKATSYENSVRASVGSCQGPKSEQIPFARRPHALYPRM